MKGIFIDTNIFVEMFVRTGKKSERSNKLLKKEDGLCTNSLVISEVEWVLRAGYGVKKEDIVRGIKKILTSSVEIEDKKLLINVLNFYEAKNIDWTDCLNMFLLKEENITGVYSYDRGLNKFDWIKRLEP